MVNEKHIPAKHRLLSRISVPVKEARVQTGAIKTSYLEAGSGSPVVLLHGSSMGNAYWTPLIAPLAARFRVIAPDIVGFGESDQLPVIYDRACFASWLKDFFKALKLQKTSLVGHSLGGAIALQFTLDNPEQVERLALVNSAALGWGRAIPGAILGSLWKNTFPSAAAIRWTRRYTQHNADSTDDVLLEYSMDMGKRQRFDRQFWRSLYRTARPIRTKELARITQPTLIIWGADDPVLTLSHALSARQALPNSRLHIIEQARHDPLYDRPKEFTETLIEFLQDRLQ